jgi:hypothetical protein
VCVDIGSFLQHMDTAHPLDDAHTGQYRLQMALVESLDGWLKKISRCLLFVAQLVKERNRLNGMMQHLHMKHQQSPDSTTHQRVLPFNLLNIVQRQSDSVSC